MRVKTNEFMIGLSLSIAAVIVIFTILWLGKSNFFMQGINLNLLVDNANGITSGNEVFYRGLKIGTITDAVVTKNGILLKMKIKDAEEIPIDSKFEIGEFNLISGTAVEITPGSSPIHFQANDTVSGTAAYGLNQAIAGLQTVEVQIKDVLTNIKALTGNGTRRKVNTVLDRLDKTIADIDLQVNGNLKETLTNVNEITSDNKKNIKGLISSLSENSRELSDFLHASSKSASQLDSLLSNLNAGKGSLGGLVKSDSMYENLNRTIASIDSLVNDIRANPKRYVNVSVF